jgi:hypothetical protein
MKKLIIGMALFALATGSVSHAGKYDWNGAGVAITATTTPQLVLVPGTNYCYAVTVSDESTTEGVRWEKVSYGVTTLLAATNNFVAVEALITPAEKSYTSAGGTMMNEEKRRQIGGVVIATTNGTAVVVVNFE